MDMPIIVEVVASRNPAVGNTDNNGNMEVLPSMHLFAKFKRSDLNITLSFPLDSRGKRS